MIKKIIKILFFLILSFFILNKPLLAQNNNSLIDETNNQLEILESLTGLDLKQTCGIANDINYNKCCNSLNLDNTIDISDQEIKQDIPGSEKILKKINDIIGFKKIFNNSNKINPCLDGKPSTDDYNDPNCICLPIENQTKILCEKYLKDNPKEYNLCVDCAENKKGVWTAIGCVEGDFSQFISGFLLKTALGFAGIFAFLCIIYASFLMQSSQGNQEKLKKAQELLTSCIMGLILIIFSVFILKLIGVNILQLPYLK